MIISDHTNRCEPRLRNRWSALPSDLISHFQIRASQLMELRKKQRAQDAAAEALAKQTGMTARKQSAELAKNDGDRKRDKPADGVCLGGGVLHVSSKQIRNVRYHAGKGGGKGGMKDGGKGKGGRGGGNGKGRRGGKSGGRGGGR